MSNFTEKDIDNIQNMMNGGAPAQAATPPPSTPATSADTTPPAGSTPPPAGTTPPPGTSAGAAAAAPATPAEDEYFELEKLGFNSFNDLQDRLNKANEYEKQVQELNEYKAGPKFKSDRHKFIYDFAGDERFEGMELNAARQLLEVVSLDLTNLPDQQIRFEAFRLKPEVKGLSQDEVYSLFAAEEVERFGNAQDTANPQTDVQKIRAKQATAQAREQLSKVKTDWESTKPVIKTPEQEAQERMQYRQFLAQQIAGFDGIQLKLSAQDEKGEKLEGALNYKLDPEKQLAAITEALANPAGWWDHTLEQLGIMSNESKVPDFKKFAQFITEVVFRQDLLNNAYQQGRTDQLADKLKGARNVGAVGDTGADGGTTPPLLSDQQAATKAAMKVAGMI